MKKYIFILLSFFYLGSIFTVNAYASKPKVVATFSILGDLVHQIAGDAVDLKTLVGPNGDAHVYEPTPQDAKSIMHADVIIMNGLGFEGWLTRLLDATKTKAKIIKATNKIKPLPAKENAQVMDPHAWHDIKNAILYGEAILEALINLSPKNKEKFSNNWAVLRKKLENLDREFKNKVQSIPLDLRKVITLHDGFQYLGHAYGIEFLTPLGISTEAEPSAKDLVSIIKEAKAHNIKVIFIENISNNRVMEQVAKESGAKLGDLLFSDALSEKEEGAETFLDMVRHNFSIFINAFKSSQRPGQVIVLQES